MAKQCVFMTICLSVWVWFLQANKYDEHNGKISRKVSFVQEKIQKETKDVVGKKWKHFLIIIFFFCKPALYGEMEGNVNVFCSTEILVNYDDHYVSRRIVMWSYMNY